MIHPEDNGLMSVLAFSILHPGSPARRLVAVVRQMESPRASPGQWLVVGPTGLERVVPDHEMRRLYQLDPQHPRKAIPRHPVHLEFAHEVFSLLADLVEASDEQFRWRLASRVSPRGSLATVEDLLAALRILAVAPDQRLPPYCCRRNGMAFCTEPRGHNGTVHKGWGLQWQADEGPMPFVLPRGNSEPEHILAQRQAAQSEVELLERMGFATSVGTPSFDVLDAWAWTAEHLKGWCRLQDKSVLARRVHGQFRREANELRDWHERWKLPSSPSPLPMGGLADVHADW